MTLREWLTSMGMSRAEFAPRVGASPRTIGNILNGYQRPSTALAARIQEVTRGAVTAADWPPRHNGKTALRAGGREVSP